MMTIAAGVALIVLAVAGRLILGAYAPKPVKPAAGGYLGVAEAGETASYQPVDDFAAAVGRKPNIVLYYSSWKEAFNTRFAGQVHAHGAMPFVQIDPGHTSLATIASGRDDAFVRSYARQVRAYGHPVIIGFAAEMNGDWNPWGYRHTPARMFVAAWRHLVTVFRQQGAGNVIWLWTVNVTDSRTGPVQDWWPGAAYVTWVGIDGYYFKRDYTFDNAFLPTIAEVRIFTKRPILLSETGVGQRGRSGGEDPRPVRRGADQPPARLRLVRPDAGRRPLPPGLAARGSPGRAGRVPPRPAVLSGPGAGRHGSGRACPAGPRRCRGRADGSPGRPCGRPPAPPGCSAASSPGG